MKFIGFALFFCLLSGIPAGAQVNFEKGYFIGINGDRVDCLIKNKDWMNTPDYFYVRVAGDQAVLTKHVDEVSEFGIYTDQGIVKYRAVTIPVDHSLNTSGTAFGSKMPVWKQERMFIKTLVEGKASLYSYEKGSEMLFFYSLGNSVPEQLIYKRYWASGLGTQTLYNKTYLTQLWTNARCASMKFDYLEQLPFRQKPLEEYFKVFNACGEPDKKTGSNTAPRKKLFHIRITPGLNFSNFNHSNISPGSIDLNNSKLLPRLGLEAELVLPFLNNKWSAIFEPTFEQYKDEKSNTQLTVEVQLRSIELPVGLRYAYFLSRSSRVFLNVFVVPFFNIDLGSGLYYKSISSNKIGKTPSNPVNSYAFGGGIEHKRYSLQLRYYTNRRSFGFGKKETRFAVIAGFRIF